MNNLLASFFTGTLAATIVWIVLISSYTIDIDVVRSYCKKNNSEYQETTNFYSCIKDEKIIFKMVKIND